eukprot:CAMPEP_0180706036 /NCGR_PEP_ID=MMETSP1038_2-20121128/7989_1 /TAXON_ID=632150 /ORGANISM="Azadinium spinosum, Strain 3D9" /LENGTH=98 /DNA_ID=CAMNT_0022737937 /DNA_START=394 /DNA_END=690 /DNA_ORIENTATION=+
MWESTTSRRASAWPTSGQLKAHEEGLLAGLGQTQHALIGLERGCPHICSNDRDVGIQLEEYGEVCGGGLRLLMTHDPYHLSGLTHDVSDVAQRLEGAV